MRISDERVHKNIGTFLRRARMKKGLEQKEVARMIRLKQAQYISNVENGKVAISTKSLKKLLRVYGISRDRAARKIGREIQQYYMEHLG